jgi:SAM-dependent methyltransferase
MARLAHTYVAVDDEGPARTTLDVTPVDFAETMRYRTDKFETEDDFLAYCKGGWRPEVHEALARVLRRERSILSIGSGLGEHEVPFARAGYDITASEIVPGALQQAARFFPELKTRFLDVLDPDLSVRYDDVLVASLDYVLDDEQLERLLLNVKLLLRPRGRLIFVQRYNDNLATWAIDEVFQPLWARWQRARRPWLGLVRKQHGYRRTRREIETMANRLGYRLGRVEHAGFGAELQRIGIDLKLPRAYAVVRRLDRLVHVFNVATLFEFLPETR